MNWVEIYPMDYVIHLLNDWSQALVPGKPIIANPGLDSD